MTGLIGVEEAARLLDVPVSCVYAKTRNNEIPHFKLGKYVKFSPESLLEWLNKHRRGCDEGQES